MRILLLTAFSVMLFSSSQAIAKQMLGNPQIGRCHMDYCWWYKIIDKKEIKKKDNAVLYEVIIMNGDHQYKNGQRYPSKFTKKTPITWEKKTSKNYFLCHPKVHYIKFENEDGMIADFRYPAGANEGALGMYLNVCYNVGDGASLVYGNYAERHGLTDTPEGLEDKIAKISPEKIFEYLK